MRIDRLRVNYLIANDRRQIISPVNGSLFSREAHIAAVSLSDRHGLN